MARDLGMRRATVAEAAASESENALFDRRLADLIRSVIPVRETELEALKELENEMKQTGIVGLAEMRDLMAKYGFQFTSMTEAAVTIKKEKAKKK